MFRQQLMDNRTMTAQQKAQIEQAAVAERDAALANLQNLQGQAAGVGGAHRSADS